MAGHSKWSQIKRQKGVTDAVRGKVFTKFAKEIHVAVKFGGSDPNGNARLRDLITKARKENMPNDNIQRAIKNALGEGKSTNYENITYEGYGLGGVAIMVEAMTDNKNRTAGEVRHAFEKYGGSLGVSGSVGFVFDGTKPTFYTPLDEEQSKIFEKMLDKFDSIDDVTEVYHNAE